MPIVEPVIETVPERPPAMLTAGKPDGQGAEGESRCRSSSLPKNEIT